MKFNELFEPKPGSLAAEKQKTIDVLRDEIAELRRLLNREQAFAFVMSQVMTSCQRKTVEIILETIPKHYIQVPNFSYIYSFAQRVVKEREAVTPTVIQLKDMPENPVIISKKQYTDLLARTTPTKRKEAGK